MSVSSVSTTHAAVAAQQTQPIIAAKAADGDRKVAGANTSKTKDADGDYKMLSGTLTRSTSRVQAALSMLKPGG